MSCCIDRSHSWQQCLLLLVAIMASVLLYTTTTTQAEVIQLRMKNRIDLIATGNPLAKEDIMAFAAVDPNGNPVADLEGGTSSLHLFYVEVQVGSRGQKFYLQVDTGSSDMAFPKMGCSTCGVHSNAPYDPTTSATSQLIFCNSTEYMCPRCSSAISDGCEYSNTYFDGSGFSAVVYTDDVTIGGVTVRAPFGAITVVPTTFGSEKTDGVLGLGYSTASAIVADTLTDLLAENHTIDANVFSMCMTRFNGGVLTLGGVSPDYANSVDYVDLVPSTHYIYYRVHVHDLMLDGKSLGVSPDLFNDAGTIVDSGASLWLMPSTAYKAFMNSMQSLCATRYLPGVCADNSIAPTLWKGNCIYLEKSDLERFPDLQISLSRSGGQTNDKSSALVLSVPASRYLIQGRCPNFPTWYSLGIQETTDGTVMILGNTFMSAFETVFDKDNNRVGFAPIVKCGGYDDSNDNAASTLGAGAGVVVGIMAMAILAFVVSAAIGNRF